MSEETKVEVSGTSPEENETALGDIGRAIDEAGLANLLLDKFDPSDETSQTEPPEPEHTAKEEEAEPSVNENSSDADVSAPEDDDDTSVLSQDNSSDEEPEWFQKRIDKLTRQRREAESEVKDLRVELDKVKESVGESSPQPVIGSGNPFQHLTDNKEIDAKIQSARETKKWARANRDGAVVEGKNGEVEYTPEQVEDILNNAEDALDIHLPAQKEFIQAKQYWDEESVKAYPWLTDKGSKEYEVHENNLNEFPAIKALPNHRILIADMMLGQAVRYQEGQKTKPAKGSKQRPKAPPQPSAPSATPVDVDAQQARGSSAVKRFNQTQHPNDLTDVILNNFL